MRHAIGSTAFDLHGRIRRRPLLDSPRERLGRHTDFRSRRNRRILQRDHLAFNIFRRTMPAQEEGRPISLRHPLKIIEQAGRRPKADHEHAGGQRVERSGMAGLRPCRQPHHPVDDSARGQPARLVQVQQTGRRCFRSSHGDFLKSHQPEVPGTKRRNAIPSLPRKSTPTFAAGRPHPSVAPIPGRSKDRSCTWPGPGRRRR